MNDKVKKIILVFKAHFDYGYTAPAGQVLEDYRRKVIPAVIKTCEESRKFGGNLGYVWTMPAWLLAQVLKPGSMNENQINKVRELIKYNQIAWTIMPFTPNTEFCGLEEYIRGLYISRSLSEEFGRWPVSAKMTDVPGHTWIVPSILSKAGVRFLQLGCNPAFMPVDVPRLFYWEGPDKSKVLTYYSKGQYGTPLIPPDDWNYPVWLALVNVNDNLGPHTAHEYVSILSQLREKAPGAEIITGTLDDFYNEVSPYLSDIPVIHKEIGDPWIHGAGTYPNEVKKLRASRIRLTAAEKALSFGMINKVIDNEKAADLKIKTDDAYEHGILFGEHTWGLATMIDKRRYFKAQFVEDKKNVKRYSELEESWHEKAGRATKSIEITLETSKDIFDSLAGAIEIDGPRLVLFNSLNWDRDCLADIEEYSCLLEDKCLIDSTTGKEAEIIYINQKRHIKARLPAAGYKTYIIRDTAESDQKATMPRSEDYQVILENRWFRIEADKQTGSIRSLIDKTSGKEWVDNTKPFGFGQYRYDIYGDEEITEYLRRSAFRIYHWFLDDFGRNDYPYSQEHECFNPHDFSVRRIRNKKSSTIIMETSISDKSFTEFGNAKKLITEITLYDEFPYIDLEYKLDRKQETPFIESGHIIFPVNLNNPEISINKPGSVIDPSNGVVRKGNNFLYCVENWVDLSDGKNGIAVIAYDTPLFSIGNSAIYKYYESYRKNDPVLFFNTFNNQWATNFPQWLGGNYSFKYRLIPHKGSWKESDLWRLSLESITPAFIGYAPDKTACTPSLPAASSEWINVSEGMLIQTVKPSEDGNGFIIRLREIKGDTGNVTLSIPFTCKSIDVCDLLERDQKNLGINTRQITLYTLPFELHTIRISI